MPSSFVKVVCGSLGLILCYGSLSPIARAVESPPSLMAQEADAQCANFRSNAVREWLERSRLYAQTEKPKQAAQALLRAFGLMGRSQRDPLRGAPNSTSKMETLRFITEAQPTGILQSLIELSLKEKQPETALSVLSPTLAIAHSLPTAYSAVKTQTLTAIAQYYLDLDQPEQATEILGQAMAAAAFLQGDEFQTKALTAIAKVYANLDDQTATIRLLDQSLEFAQRVKHPNSYRNAWVLEPIALTYAQVGAFEQALQVANLPDPSANHYRNQAIAAVINGYGEKDQLDQGLSLLDKIDDPNQRAVILAKFAAKRLAQGKTAAAQGLLDQAIANAKSLETTGLQNSSLSSIAQIYVKESGQAIAALPILNLITNDSYHQIQALNVIASLVTDAEQNTELVDRGLIAAQQLEPPEIRTGWIHGFIGMHFDQGRWAIALERINALSDEDSFADKYTLLENLATQATAAGAFDIALEATALIPETWNDARNRHLQNIVVGYARTGDFATARKLWTDIDNQGVKPYQVTTLVAIANQAILQGDPARAATLINEAQTLIPSLFSPQQQTYGFATLAIHAATTGDTTAVTQYQNQILKLAQAQNNPSDFYFLKDIVDLYLKANQYELALQTAIAIPNLQAEQAWILNNIADALIQAEAIEPALKAIDIVTRPADKAQFLTTIASYYITDGNFNGAAIALQKAFTAAQTVTGEELQTISLRAHDPITIDDYLARGRLLEAIALKYADIGQVEDGIKIAQTLQTPSLRTDLLQKLNCY